MLPRPQLIFLVLLALKEGKHAIIAKDTIVEYTTPDHTQQYDRATVFAGLPLLLQVPLDWSTKKTLGRMVGEMLGTPESLALWVSQTPADSWCVEEKPYQYKASGKRDLSIFF